ncbi:hypothetical protein KKF91_01660 [Myxococcota bacterium]|nr:hypothetical protein [Myxococcota bacterium]MBU1429242.1 hypothetical protein [Myxococcota bacterium]MBU1897991.1 hypothetical protein [Myxococcota bacterium]
MRLDRCPACKARLRGDEPLDQPCRRCGADLGLTRRAERQAEAAQRRARQALAAGEGALAFSEALRALRLVDAPSTRQTVAAALICVARLRRDQEDSG